jgi:hypothetical protein
VSSSDPAHAAPFTATDAVAGLMAASAAALAAISIADRPARLSAVAIVLALVAARMSERFSRFALGVTLFGMLAWVVGMTLAVITENPLI